MASNVLVTYRPLCGRPEGRAAIAKHGLPAFVDGSCRREPDFESRSPAITALCRGAKLAPRLQVEDRIAYMTKRGSYGDEPTSHWRLTALFRVTQRFESHDDAAASLRQRGESLPRNLMVAGNSPLPLAYTDGVMPEDVAARRGSLRDDQILRLWDASYRARAQAHPVVLICEPIYVNHHAPKVIRGEDWMRWNGRVPGTQNPPSISDELWSHLLKRSQEAG